MKKLIAALIVALPLMAASANAAEGAPTAQQSKMGMLTKRPATKKAMSAKRS